MRSVPAAGAAADRRGLEPWRLGLNRKARPARPTARPPPARQQRTPSRWTGRLHRAGGPRLWPTRSGRGRDRASSSLAQARPSCWWPAVRSGCGRFSAIPRAPARCTTWSRSPGPHPPCASRRRPQPPPPAHQLLSQPPSSVPTSLRRRTSSGRQSSRRGEPRHQHYYPGRSTSSPPPPPCRRGPSRLRPLLRTSRRASSSQPRPARALRPCAGRQDWLRQPKRARDCATRNGHRRSSTSDVSGRSPSAPQNIAG